MNMPVHIVAVGGITQDTDGNVLLVKTHNNGWVFPGGQVEVGENLIEALKREIQEESGIEVEVKEMIGMYSNVGINKWHDGVSTVPTKLIIDFQCTPIGGCLAISEETSESLWVPIEEVVDKLTLPVMKERFKNYIDRFPGVVYKSYVTQPHFEIRYEKQI